MGRRQREAKKALDKAKRDAGLADGSIKQHLSNKELVFMAEELQVRLADAELECKELEDVVDRQHRDILALQAHHAYRHGALTKAEAEVEALKAALVRSEQQNQLQLQELLKTQHALVQARRRFLLFCV